MFSSYSVGFVFVDLQNSERSFIVAPRITGREGQLSFKDGPTRLTKVYVLHLTEYLYEATLIIMTDISLNLK